MSTLADKADAQKLLNFAAVFHQLSCGRPMTAYVAQRDLLLFAGTPNFSSMHWSYGSGWLIAEALERQYLIELEKLLAAQEVMAFSCDESTDVSTSSRLSLTLYIERGWQRESYLLAFPKILGSANAENLTSLIIQELSRRTGLSVEQLAARLIMFAADGASVLQGQFNGVIKRVKEQIAPFAHGMHCFSHRANLAAHTLDAHAIMQLAVATCKSTYNFYSKSVARLQGLVACQEELGVSTHKLLRDVETRWISHAAPMTRLLEQFPAVLKHVVDLSSTEPHNLKVQEMYSRLTDLERLLALAAVQPMLAELQVLIKVTQKRDVYVGDLSDAITSTLSKLDQLYLQEGQAFTGAPFAYLCKLEGCIKKSAARRRQSPLQLCDSEEGGTAVIRYEYGDESVEMNAVPRRTGMPGRPLSTPQPLTKKDFKVLLADVKAQTSAAAKALRLELIRRFPSPKVLTALSIMYPQYYRNFTEANFNAAIETICAFYGESKTAAGKEVPPVLNADTLRAQASAYVDAAQDVSREVLERKERDGIAGITLLWTALTTSGAFAVRISEFVKLAKIAVVMVGGSVEDERNFSVMNFVKIKLRNSLDDHLELCMRLKSQSMFTLATFPFVQAMRLWRDAAPGRGRYAA